MKYNAMNDTLVTVDLSLYIPSPGQQAGCCPPAYAGSNETNTLIVEVWGDDGGVIDTASGPLFSHTIGPGLANVFPASLEDRNNVGGAAFEVHNIPVGMIVRGNFYVTARWSSSDNADGGAWGVVGDFLPRGYAHFTSTEWEDVFGIGWTDFWGNEAEFHIGATLCMDEFQLCQTQYLYNPAVGLTAGWYLDENFLNGGLQNFSIVGQRVAGNPDNSVEGFRFALLDEVPFGGAPGENGTPGVRIFIWADGGGEPGAVLYTEDIATPVYYPGWNDISIPNVFATGDFWVGLMPIVDDPGNEWFYVGSQIAATPTINGGAWTLYEGFCPVPPPGWNCPEWISNDLFGNGPHNYLFEVDFCSIPVAIWPCTPGTEWPTLQGNYARDGHSGNPLGDAQCDLTNIWSFNHPTKATNWGGPAIRDGKVIQPFGDEYQVFLLADGTPLHTFGPFGTQIFSVPTIETIDIGGGPVDLVFLNGGNDGYVYCYDWNTYAPVFSYSASAGAEQTRWGNFMVLNDGTTNVLYYAEDVSATVFAIDIDQSYITASGTAYATWPGGGFSTTGFSPTTTRTGVTNGVDVVYYGIFDAGFEGDVVALDAFTGSVNWKLSTAGGLQGQSLYSLGFSDEGFQGSLSFEPESGSDPNRLYGVSNLGVGGVFYVLNADDGSILANSTTNTVRFGGTPIVDATKVIVPHTYFVSAQYDAGNMIAYNKITGNEVWAFMGDGNLGDDRFYLDALMTCERDLENEGPDDVVYGFNEGGYLIAINAVTGNEVFQRRIDHAAIDTLANNVGISGALVPDTMAWSSLWGGLFVLAKTDVDRPRLKIVSDGLRSGIEFGASTDTLITFDEPALTNTGCAPLTVTLVVEDSTNGTQAWVGPNLNVTPGAWDASTAIADMLVDNRLTSIKNPIGVGMTPEISDDIVKAADSRVRSNRASSAAPPYVTQASYGPYVLAPGDTITTEIRVDKTQLIRGIYKLFYEVQSDDPDHFLNDNSLYPELGITLIYGCPLNYEQLDFGVGGANYQVVTNTGYLGDGDYFMDPLYDGESHGFYIDEEGAEYYQGGYGMGVSQHRIAMYTQDWASCPTCPLDQMDAIYASMQPDKNFYSGECAPGVNSSVGIPEYSTDGFTYTPFNATAIYSTFIDSVELWLNDTGIWDWEEVRYDGTDGFDNDSTFGTFTNSYTIGIVDAPGALGMGYLNSLTIQVLSLNERNGGTIDDLGFWHFADADIGGDSANFNGAINSAWAFGTGLPIGEGIAFGQTKLPIADGYDGMYNALSLAGISGDPGAGFWGDSTYWDSAYFYTTTGYPSGLTGLPASAGDGEIHFTHISMKDLGANEEVNFAIVNWRLGDLNDSEDDWDPDIVGLVTIANQLAGFDRGDVNADGSSDIGDIVYVANHVHGGGPGAVPFAHLADVNADGNVDGLDIEYYIQYYFFGGPAPIGDWTI
jgi:hypothetical protein